MKKNKHGKGERWWQGNSILLNGVVRERLSDEKWYLSRDLKEMTEQLKWTAWEERPTLMEEKCKDSDIGMSLVDLSSEKGPVWWK